MSSTKTSVELKPDTPTLPMPANPRFRWPMRIFLSIVVFNMIFRSLSGLYPWSDWMEELEMRELPDRLPTRGEISELSDKATAENPNLVLNEVLTAADSTWEYFRPWPGKETRPKLKSTSDWGKYAFCWMTSRFNFIETVLGINQDWPMFSPNVSKKKWITRSRLYFEDGSEQIVRQTADPEDLTNYSHWFQEKILDYELNIQEGRGRFDDCRGYCNLLAHHYPRNGKGSPLVKIELFQVRYDYCPPGEDPVAFYRAQNGPPPSQVGPTFFIYDPSTKKGRMVD